MVAIRILSWILDHFPGFFTTALLACLRPFSYLRVGGHGRRQNRPPFAPPVFRRLKTFWNAWSGPVFDVVDPASSRSPSASCAINPAVKNCSTEVVCSCYVAKEPLLTLFYLLFETACLTKFFSIKSLILCSVQLSFQVLLNVLGQPFSVSKNHFYTLKWSILELA